MLIESLPPDSATARSLRPGGLLSSWSTAESLLALVAELLDHNNRLVHQVHFKPPHPEPLRLPRPSDMPNVPARNATPGELKELLGGQVSVHYVPSQEAE